MSSWGLWGLHTANLPPGSDWKAADAFDDEHETWDDEPPVSKTGVWYHSSPHKLEPGTRLLPGHKESVYSDFYDEEDGISPHKRKGWVWLEPDKEGAAQWTNAHLNNYLYEVHPDQEPHPWNGTGSHGHVTPSAVVKRMVGISPEGDYEQWHDLPPEHTAATIDGIRYAAVVEADVAEDLFRLGMAWDEFYHHITPATAAGGPVGTGESCKNCPQPNYPDGFKYIQRPGSNDRWNYSGGKQMRYRIKHPDNSESYLAYGHYLDGDSKPYLGINMISTDPNHQHQGVAESLIRKLHEDHPGVPIDPGGMTDAGKAFKNRLEERIPDASNMLRRRSRLAARPKKITPPWSDFHNGQAYPLQNQPTADLIHMFYSLRDAHRAGDPPADGVTPFADRIPHYEAELLDRHEAGDPEATKWADRGSYIKPDYMSDAEWQDNLRMYPEDYPVDPRPRRRRKPTAAVNQGLVDRLHDEFHQWWENKQNLDTDPASADYWKGNGVSKPIQYWPHIEEFLSHKYPASNRWHDMGMEEAGHILDGHKPMPYQVQSGADTTPYETGPEAIATYGYDPKEIAAGMLLLHNRSNPLRGDMLPQDQARLNDIFQKRQQMQRDYEQRTKTAIRTTCPRPGRTDPVKPRPAPLKR